MTDGILNSLRFKTFHVPQETMDDIRARVDAGEKVEPLLRVDVLDEAGEIVARVEKRLYVRKKTTAPDV